MTEDRKPHREEERQTDRPIEVQTDIKIDTWTERGIILSLGYQFDWI